MRLCNHESDFEEIYDLASIDDIIVISNDKYPFEASTTSSVEKIMTPEIKEIKYLLSLTNIL
ncbi:hypothetical protein [Flavobacterium gelidilacus]|uniref:hypothetical protein n=1 Tax=Flavobacterium gelidilacus TaxID=206041 RepID=UPI0012FC9A9E|nr:hypothetical protein [Flavobacterium gelidilacus]